MPFCVSALFGAININRNRLFVVEGMKKYMAQWCREKCDDMQTHTSKYSIQQQFPKVRKINGINCWKAVFIRRKQSQRLAHIQMCTLLFCIEQEKKNNLKCRRKAFHGNRNWHAKLFKSHVYYSLLLLLLVLLWSPFQSVCLIIGCVCEWVSECVNTIIVWLLIYYRLFCHERRRQIMTRN